MSKFYQIQVGPHRKQGYTMIPVMALQVKFPGQAGFGNFYESIEGFNHVDGHHYVLDIEQAPLPEGVIYADRANVDYKLVKIVSDTKVA